MPAIRMHLRCVQGPSGRPFSLLLLVLAGLLLAANAWAGTFNAYGPQTFTRTTSAPATTSLAFDVLDPEAQYELRITENSLSSAIVTVNDAEIFGAQDFNQNVTTLTKPLHLVAHN